MKLMIDFTSANVSLFFSLQLAGGSSAMGEGKGYLGRQQTGFMHVGQKSEWWRHIFCYLAELGCVLYVCCKAILTIAVSIEPPSSIAAGWPNYFNCEFTTGRKRFLGPWEKLGNTVHPFSWSSDTISMPNPHPLWRTCLFLYGWCTLVPRLQGSYEWDASQKYHKKICCTPFYLLQSWPLQSPIVKRGLGGAASTAALKTVAMQPLR